MERCYATKGFFQMNNVRETHTKNWELSKRSDFVDEMIAEIRQMGLKLLRIHVAGDFYGKRYIRKWIKIAKACPDVQFYAYTRSWRKKALLPALELLAEVENVSLWWSCDKDTDEYDGQPPAVPSVGVTYMQVDPGEAIPDYVDLIFRVKRKTIEKFVGSCFVCPAENGVKPKPHCDKCALCWSDKDMPRKKVREAHASAS